MNSLVTEYADRYTQSMTFQTIASGAGEKLTTIKVSAATRDRLKARADRFEWSSLDAYINALIDGAEEVEYFTTLNRQLAFATDEELADYTDETTAWQGQNTESLRDEPAW